MKMHTVNRTTSIFDDEFKNLKYCMMHLGLYPRQNKTFKFLMIFFYVGSSLLALKGEVVI